MDEEQQAAGGTRDEVPKGSVFGNLPDSRPGVRSPRRPAGDATAAPGPASATPKPVESRPPPREAEPKQQGPSEEPREASDELDEDEGRGGLDDLAWAGVAAAAEAATLGVRLANRALESLRDAVDRR